MAPPLQDGARLEVRSHDATGFHVVPDDLRHDGRRVGVAHCVHVSATKGGHALSTSAGPFLL